MACAMTSIVRVSPLALGLALTLLAACHSSVKVGPEAVAGLTPDGTVDMNQVQAAFIGSAGGGTGTLYYRGGAYQFHVAGLGVGGIGVSTIDANGEVYSFPVWQTFPVHTPKLVMASPSARSAAVTVDAERSGVILHLKAKRTGLMLSLGGDAVAISLNQ